MIEFLNNDPSEPYKIFKSFYNKALSFDQKSIEAISISSLNKRKQEVDSRYVNLKYIDGTEWIFFTNYESPKAQQFREHDQISALFYWQAINVQIRIKANIKPCSQSFSDKHFLNRSESKNALARSSMQSKKIDSYEEVVTLFKTMMNSDKNYKRPPYWGGYSFTPYSFEFWEGHKSRLNIRNLYEKKDGKFYHSILQP
jgi:pyridoxamine 5'-phosphate oxidase